MRTIPTAGVRKYARDLGDWLRQIQRADESGLLCREYCPACSRRCLGVRDHEKSGKTSDFHACENGHSFYAGAKHIILEL
ncbi:MAG: hypothetical protein ACRDQZ_25460 [Mycobacteriales bacterium]